MHIGRYPALGTLKYASVDEALLWAFVVAAWDRLSRSGCFALRGSKISVQERDGRSQKSVWVLFWHEVSGINFCA